MKNAIPSENTVKEAIAIANQRISESFWLEGEQEWHSVNDDWEVELYREDTKDRYTAVSLIGLDSTGDRDYDCMHSIANFDHNNPDSIKIKKVKKRY